MFLKSLETTESSLCTSKLVSYVKSQSVKISMNFSIIYIFPSPSIMT